MEIKLLKTFADARTIIAYSDGYLTVDYLGIHGLDQHFLPTWEIIDFFNADEAILVQQRYLLLKNCRVGFKVYSLDTKKEISFLPLSKELEGGTNSFLLSPDEKVLYFMTGVPLVDSMEEEMQQMLPTESGASLTSYSLPKLKKLESYPMLETAHTMKYCRFLNSFVLEDKECNLYRYDLQHWENLYLKAGGCDFVFFENREEIYCPHAYSLRVYRGDGREINKLDLASDEKKIMGLNWQRLLSSLNANFNEEDYQVANKESIEYICPWKENLMFVQIRECSGAYHRLEMVDVTTGESIYSLMINFDVFFLRMISPDYIVFEVNKKLHLLEVTYDQ